MRVGLFKSPMLFQDVLVRCPRTGHFGVVVPAQDVGRSFQRVVADSPASLCVAIDLTHAGVHTDSDCTNERGLAEVGTEA